MKWNKPANIIIQILISILVLLLILQPDISFISLLSEYTIWIIISLITIGLIAMFSNNRSLVYFSMFTAGILTFYLKDLSNQNLVFNKHINKETALHIMHVDIFNVEESKPELLNIILKKDPDIISFEELTPDWNDFLKKNLQKKYKSIFSLNRLDYDSKLVLSKYKFISKDTFELSGHPQMDVTVFFRNNPIKIILPYVVPYPVFDKNDIKRYQLDELADYINKSHYTNLIVAGEFNQVYWTKGIRSLLYKTKLNNARRFISFEINNPYDHIFYSKKLKCIELNEILDSKENHIGIEAFFKIIDANQVSIKN